MKNNIIINYNITKLRSSLSFIDKFNGYCQTNKTKLLKKKKQPTENKREIVKYTSLIALNLIQQEKKMMKKKQQEKK